VTRISGQVKKMGWLNRRNGWLSKRDRGLADTDLLGTACLWVQNQTYPRIKKMGDIAKDWPNKLLPTKKYEIVAVLHSIVIV
jgi:hypothetical protein